MTRKLTVLLVALAAQLGRRAARAGFDWPDATGPLAKIAEELDELAVARVGDDEAAVTDELGDVLFAIVNVARHLGVDPELALRAAAGKFRRRFEAVEVLAAGRDIDLRAADLTTLDALWDEVKAGRVG